LLGGSVSDGLVVTDAMIEPPWLLAVILGNCHLLNPRSLEAPSETLKILRANGFEEKLALFLISGGGSALFEIPIYDEITLPIMCSPLILNVGHF
jgi:glycerate-2-kinase